MKFSFTLDDDSLGWATVRLRAHGDIAEFPASYLSDPVGDVVSACLRLLDGSEEEHVVFEAEPGRHVLRVTQRGPGTVRFTVYWDEEDSASDAEAIISDSLSTREFCLGISKGLQQLQRQTGEAAYEANWSMPFPGHKLDLLRQRAG